jgi:hypothetical protein
LWDYYLSSPFIANNITFWGSGDSVVFAIGAKNGDLSGNIKPTTLHMPLLHFLM